MLATQSKEIIPTDPEGIATRILEQYEITHIEGNYYNFDSSNKRWESCTLDNLRQVILSELPGTYSMARANNVLEVMRLKTMREPQPIDTNKIHFANGILDLETNEFRPYQFTDYVINPINVNYIPGAQCPRFTQFLNEIFEDDKDATDEEKDAADKTKLLQEFTGYCLTKDVSFQKALLLIGSGANGKSVILSVMEGILGSNNVSNLELRQFADRFSIAALQNKFLNISSELDTREKVVDDVFKRLTGGDRLQAERKFLEPFQFQSYVRLLFATNHLPVSSDASLAFYRRWLILKFNKTFKAEQQDRSLTSKLIQELPGVVNWALVGLRRLRHQNKFTEPKSHVETLKAFEVANNNVLAYINECVEDDPGSPIELKTLYSSYVSFCHESNFRPKSRNNFRTEVERLIPSARYYQGHGIYKFENIKLIMPSFE